MAADFDKTKEKAIYSDRRGKNAPQVLRKAKLASQSQTPLFLQGKSMTAAATEADASEFNSDSGERPGAGLGLVVEDSPAQVLAGQMKKSEFLERLREAVTAEAAEALSGTPWSAVGCPWIDHWFDYYAAVDVGRIERAVRKYAPSAAGAETADELIPILSGRVRRAIEVWSVTGEMGEAAAEGMGAGPDAGGEVPDLMMKEREGGSRDDADPREVQSRLGEGTTLDGSLRSRMESAYGEDFSDVRVHADAKGAELSTSVDARAFAVGEHIAFGPGEYRPGTVIGDALIAHELAHVRQQSGGSNSRSLSQKETDAKGGDDSLEVEADNAAVGAVVSLWGRTNRRLQGLVRNGLPNLKSGLKLQRCKKHQNAPEAAAGLEPDYDLFSQPSGLIVQEQDAALTAMVANPDQLDRVYQDAAHGDPRAAAVVEQIEEIFVAAARAKAEQSFSARCSAPVVKEFSEDCIPDWSGLSFLRRDRPGGIRLLEVTAAAYEERAHDLGIRNMAIGHALNLLLAGVTLRSALLAADTRAATAAEVNEIRGGARSAIAGQAVAEGGGVGPTIRVEAGSLEATLPPKAVPGPRPQKVLVVGAEQAEEFNYAAEVASRGHSATVVNPVVSEEAQAYISRGGDFVQGRIETLPRTPDYNIIREDFPFPLGRSFPATQEFAVERMARLAPGGSWIAVTESPEFVTTLRAAADQPGFSVTVKEAPIAHEATPQSSWAREQRRFMVTVTRAASQ